MSYEHVNKIEVSICFDQTQEAIPVGTLAVRDGQIYFQYHEQFITGGIEISPLHCELTPSLQSFEHKLFEGLPGVFADCLPDGWGRWLLDRKFMSQHAISTEQITPLDRLAHIGVNGLGALVFKPQLITEQDFHEFDFHQLTCNMQQVLEEDDDSRIAKEALDKIQLLGGSAGGARPKVLIGYNAQKDKVCFGECKLPEGFEGWLVKFPTTNDGKDVGAIEYVYALMAKEAGIQMEDTHLFETGKSAGVFGTKLFDRKGSRCFHMHTAAGLLHADFKALSLDYEDLISLTMGITRDIREAEKMYRIAVFNVLAYNRDDHGKNFSFLMDASGEWRLAPAYDLTFSSGPGGQHSTSILGQGDNIGTNELVRLGQATNISQQVMTDAIGQTKNALAKWRSLATQYGVRKNLIAPIAKKINLALK